MNEIYIPFNEWSRDKLRLKLKTATSRRKRYGEPGDTFIVEGVQYRILKQIRTTLGDVHINYWKQEGASSPEEFVSIWKLIHRKIGFDPKIHIWLHLFEKVK